MPTYAQLQTAIANARARGDTELAAQIEQTYLGGPAPSPTTAQGLLGAVAQGATLGLADELAGLIGGPGATEAARQQLETVRREMPGMALGAEMAGAIPAGFGIGSGIGVAARAPGLAGGAARFLASPTISGQATLGGIEGAISGAAMGETPAERVKGGVVGAALGAPLGGLAAPVSRALSRRFAPGQQAETMLRRELAEGGITPEGFPELARRATIEPQRTLAELGGPVTEMQAVAAHSVGGRARDIGESVLRERSAGMSDRLIDSLGENIGTRESFHTAQQRLTQQAARDAAPLYDAARAAPFQTTDDLIELGQRGIDTGDIKAGYEAARREMRLEGEVIPTWKELVEDSERGVAGFDLSTWDAIKRGLDARYKQLVRENPSLARAVWAYRQDIVSRLDAQVPEYAQARRAFAGPMEQREALEAGKKIFREDAEYTQDFIREMSQGEKDAYVIGAAQAMRDKLKNVTPEGSMPRFTDLAKERMAAAFPNQDSFKQFWDNLMSERDMQRFKNLVTGGSQTARIQAAQERQGRIAGLARAAGELVSQQPAEAARTAAAQLLPRQQTLPARISDPLAEMLFTQGAAIQPVLQRLQAPAVMPAILPPLTTTEANVLAQMAHRRMTGQ